MGVEEAAISEFDHQSSIKSADRVKFLYSYGGRIVPRHGDWKLRYVGGETRVMAVNRNITFADVMAKMTEVLGSSPVLKCQLPNQDLDALVSIRSDEDLHNILEEYKWHRTKQGSSKVRAFLFLLRTGSPSKLPVAARTSCGHTNHLPRRTAWQNPFARSGGQCNIPARCASRTLSRQHSSADGAMPSAYVEYRHCLRSFFINNRQSLPHYYTSSHSLFPSTQNTQQHIRSYMKVA